MQRRFSVGYISFEHVCKYYQTGDTVVKAVDDVNFTIEKGEFCVVLGPSGAGKTTILNLLGGMDKATSGTITVGGKQITGLRSPQLTDYRRTDVGFVFQFYNLMPNLTARENVELATELCKNALSPDKALELVGLSARAGNFPAQLSGGEQQRVSIARAVAKNPKILLCDEPTGALDYNTGKQILQLLQDTCRREKITVLIITHNSALAPMADRLIQFKNGTVISETSNPTPVPIAEIEW